jgi:two-component system cell cycle sensor histidine kinase/response regulator CckA
MISLFPDQLADQSGVQLSGVVHDFNNLLAIILTHTSIALNKLPLDSPARSYLERAVRTARRTAELSNQLLADLKSQRLEAAPLELNQVVLETVDLLNPRLALKAEVTLRLAADLHLVSANESQLQQVIMNLLLNAADAIQHTPGHITVTTRNLVVSETRYRPPDAPPPGPYVCLQVEDNGVGMDQEMMNQIFQPFFSTKATGTGIGLTTMLGIIQSHRGGVQVFSTPGAGTSFQVYLPAISDEDL